MLTHGTILGMEMGSAKLAIGMEHIGALGWHLFPQTTSEISMSRMRPVFEEFTSDALKLVAGRGIRIPSLAKWMYFILGNSVRQPKLEVQVPLRRLSDDETDEEQ